jgi:hypothetical protein
MNLKIVECVNRIGKFNVVCIETNRILEVCETYGDASQVIQAVETYV